MKKMCKVLSFLLVVLLLIQVFIPGVSALSTKLNTEQKIPVLDDGNYLTADDSVADEIEDYQTDEGEQNEFVGEVISLRDENTKHYRNADGTYTAVLYADPIHYQKNGTWADIDNSLVSKTTLLNGKNITVYETKSSAAPIVIPQNLSDGQKITVTSGGYTVAFGVSQSNKFAKLTKQAEIIDVDSLASKVDVKASISSRNSIMDEKIELPEDAIADEFTLDAITSAAVYKAILDDADLEYVVSSNKIKENIVVYNAQDEYIYKFDMDLDGLLPIKQGDGSIYLYEDENDEIPIFILQAPYMYDANDELSYDVDMEMTELDGTHILTVTADEDWINSEERAFPVVIDPTLMFNVESSSIKDAYVTNLGSSSNFGTSAQLTIGKDILSRNRTYIKFDLPDLPDCSIVTYSQLLMQKSAGSLRQFAMNVYDCNGLSTWTETGITWNNQPFSTANNGYSGSLVQDYLMLPTGSALCVMDITKITKRWYEENLNNGLMLASDDETTLNDAFFRSSEYSTSSARPSLIISYVNNTGIEDYWTYESVDLGVSGNVSVNHYNGGLTYLHNDISMNGNRMPLSINHVFTENKDNSSGTYSNMNLGNGFKLNLLERIIPLPSSDELYSSGYRYKFIDGDNTVHFFTTTSTTNQFAYEYGSDLIITKNTDNTFTMSDEKGNLKRYNTDGYLVEIEDVNSNKQSIVYSGGKITKVIDAVGREATFTYDASNYLTGITDPSGRTVSYAYSSGKLIKITYPDGMETQIAYNDKNDIQRIISADSTDLLLTYKAVTSKSKVYYRVESLEKRGTPDTAQNRETLNKLTFSYKAGQTVITDKYEKSCTYLFDRAGRTVNVRNHEEQAQYTKFNTSGNRNNSVQSATGTQAIIGNVAKNHSFEFSGDWTAWTTLGASGNNAEMVSGNNAYIGNRYMKVSNSSLNEVTYAQQSVSVVAGETYTFSAYVKIPSAYVNTDRGVQLVLNAKTTDSNSVSAKSEYIKMSNDWTRYQCTITIPENSTGEMWIWLWLGYAVGTAYFDCVQLEKSDGINQYNLLENSDFTYTTSNNPDKWSGGNLSSGDKIQSSNGKNHMMISGDASKVKYIYQTVNISAKAGDTLVYSAMSKANTAGYPNDGVGRSYAVILNLEFTDGTSISVGTDFDFNVDEFQTLNGSYTLPKDCNTIRYNLTYYRQANTAMFHSAALYLGSNASSYSYNDKGYLTKAAAGTGEATDYYYTGTDLTKIINTKDDTEINSAEYTYDDNHNIISATSSDGIKTEYFYEPQTGTTTTYGIPTRVVTTDSDGVSKTESRTAYTNDYNYVVSQTDAMGNTSQYNYDTTKGLLLSATDAKGNIRSYTYNPQNDIQLTVTGEADADTPITTTFTTDNIVLNSITRNNTSYSYEYDNMLRVASTKVGNQTLVENTYNANGTLNRTDFANGQYYEAEYDSLDRITKQKYNGIVAFEYKYNANGQLSEMTDSENGKKYTMEYDLNGRLINIVGSDAIRIKLTYDAKGNMDSLSMTENGVVVSGSMYSYLDDNNLIDKIILSTMDGGTVKYDYTSLNRLKSYTHTLKQSDTDVKMKTSFDYLTAGTNQTGVVSSMNTSLYNGETLENDLGTLSYTYDEIGNITAISENGELKASYTYDGLNQLIREDNAWAEMSCVYSYDTGGNITDIKFYTYSTGELTNLRDVLPYSYEDSNWPDLMTGFQVFNGTYDEIGNLTNADFTINQSSGSISASLDLSWTKGRQLSRYERRIEESIAEDNFTQEESMVSEYKYGHNGLRTEKTVISSLNGVKTDIDKTTYTYAGDLLMRQSDGTNTLEWVYDAGGNMLGFKHIKSTLSETTTDNYYYLRNLQGDVIGIYDDNGEVVCRYYYNAWGESVKIIAADGTRLYDNDTYHIAIINPIRYRGYYYDTESEMYYLQSRYYSPSMKRFLNADALFIAGDSLTGANMFAYCNNNPVMFVDPSGTDAMDAFWGQFADFINKIYKILFKAAFILSVNKEIRYDVPLYNQGGYSLCWAYCQVMVEDFQTGTHRTNLEADERAKEIAISVHGDDDWNKGGMPTNKSSVVYINDIFDLFFALKDGPVYAYYYQKGSAHLIVVTGVNFSKKEVYTNNPHGVYGVQTFDDFLSGYANSTGGTTKMTFGFCYAIKQ